MFSQEDQTNKSIDINEITKYVSKAVREKLKEHNVPEETIDMNVIVEVLVQVVAGYISYVKFETGHNIEEQIHKVLSLMIERFDGSYDELRKITEQEEE